MSADRGETNEAAHHERWMGEALEEADRAAEEGEVPVGAVLLSPDREVLARAGNRTRELSDPTAHAEVLAIRQAASRLGSERVKMPSCDGAIDMGPERFSAYSSAIFALPTRLAELSFSVFTPWTL